MFDRSPSSNEPAADDRTFEERYRQLAPSLRVWASLRIRASLRGYCDVDDLLQETWFRAYSIRDRFVAADVEFRPWLFRVAKNVLHEVIRRADHAHRAGLARGTTSQVYAFHAVPDSVTSLTRRLARDDDVRELERRLNELSADERDLVVLVGLEGMPQDEAAVRLGIRHDALRKRWQRVRSKLETPNLRRLLEP